ncbi:MAG: NAD-binding protein [Gemmataceae bacterium]|nr:NAD-binding protein [Gemmataceae bacterium]
MTNKQYNAPEGEIPRQSMDQHYILCGLGRVGERVLQHLHATGGRIVVIDNRCTKDDARLGGAELVRGDCRHKETFAEADLAGAKGVLIVTSEDLINIQTALMVRHLNPQVRIVVRMFNPNLLARMGAEVGNVFGLSASALSAPLFAMLARTGEALGAFRLEAGERRQIAEFTVADDSPLVGRTLADVGCAHEAQVVAHVPVGQTFLSADQTRQTFLSADQSGQTGMSAPQEMLRFGPDVDMAAPLAVGDRVVLCGEPKRVAPVVAEGENESLPELLWAGTVKRLGRMLRRGIAMIDWPVKVCTAILVGVILISVLVFHFGMKNDTLIDAFYRTISLMATGADMRGDQLEPGAWQKAFISILRLMGTALIAAFTAIFTNYLIRANLGSALEVRRIPDSGHIIVVGLGNIGYRVVEELVHQEESVVVIEHLPTNAFIATARRQGAAVIIGDATIREVLLQANAAHARAVVAATSHDLVNVEIALLVRELNPTQRVVVRMNDTNLAESLRKTAKIRLALSVPELAAPAFLAGLFGDRVRSIFLAEGQLLAVADVTVQEDEHILLENPLGELGRMFRFTPVHRAGPNRHAKSMQAEDKLAAGDRLTVIVRLEDLQKLSLLQR